MTESSTPSPTEARPPLHRRLYDWVLHWAYTPHAQPALFLLSFAESSFFPVPPDVMLLPMCLGEPRKAYRFAFLCSLASVLGGILGYYIGYVFWEGGVDEWFFTYVPGFSPEGFERISTWYGDYSFWIVFTAGFSPIPYKIFTIAAGVCHEQVDLWMFILASVISRSARFYLEAFLLMRFGPGIRDFVEKRLGMLSLLFCVLLIGGFVAVKFLL